MQHCREAKKEEKMARKKTKTKGKGHQPKRETNATLPGGKERGKNGKEKNRDTRCTRKTQEL
jgi:hypothetical protein